MEHRGKDGRTYRSLKFRAGGKRRFLSLGAVSRRDAERELRGVIADVERGVWKPPKPVEPVPEEAAVPTFHAYAEEWWLRVEDQLAPKTREDYRWRLECHLIPYFGELALDEIKVANVENYIAAKRKQGLSPRTIKMTVTLLGAVLEAALDHEVIAGRNPARGRKIRDPKAGRSYLETAAQIEALLNAAGELDAQAAKNRKHIERRASLATMVFAGLRIGELCALRWRDVDLATGWLTVAESKTPAGVRKVKIRAALRDELDAVRARRAKPSPADYVFPARSGARQDTHNVRSRVVAAAVKRASENLVAADLTPLPVGITPHSLRRTFCSLLYALGEDPGTVMDEMGHKDPALALRVYRQAMRRDGQEKAALQALVDGSHWSVLVSRDVSGDPEPPLQEAA